MCLANTLFLLKGLVLLYALNPANNGGIYFTVAVLIAIGQAGKEPPLKAFLADQLSTNIIHNSNQLFDKNKERVEARTIIWWQIPRFVGALIATFVIGNLKWKVIFLISAIVMGCALVFFLCGVHDYYLKKPTTSPLTTLFFVIKAAINKRGLPYSDEPKDYFNNDGKNQLLLMSTPNILFARYVPALISLNFFFRFC